MTAKRYNRNDSSPLEKKTIDIAKGASSITRARERKVRNGKTEERKRDFFWRGVYVRFQVLYICVSIYEGRLQESERRKGEKGAHSNKTRQRKSSRFRCAVQCRKEQQ